MSFDVQFSLLLSNDAAWRSTQRAFFTGEAKIITRE
jgi:hypothetical protein